CSGRGWSHCIRTARRVASSVMELPSVP
ncbi:hypothetical protein TNIN_295891, partial [Trichonephila inaurata madagascariensis]